MSRETKKQLKRIKYKVYSWLKENYGSVLWAVFIAGLFFYFVKSGKLNIQYTDVVETYKISVTVLASMLGFSVSIYVYLNNALQARRTNNSNERNIIDKFQEHERRKLGHRIVFSVILILAEAAVLMCGGTGIADSLQKRTVNCEMILLILIMSCVFFTYVNVIQLAHFTHEVINYENGMKNLARDMRNQEDSQGENGSIIKKGDFLNLVNNMEVLAERLIENHLHAKTSNVEDSGLQRAICDGVTELGDIENRKNFSNSYKKVIEYRNLLLQDEGMDDSKTVGLGGEVMGIRNTLFQQYLKGELLTGVSISNIELVEADLSKTSFRNSSLKNVTFKGETNLVNSDFRDSTLNEVKFKDKTYCQGINFTDSKLLDVHFDTNIDLERAIFTNADLSSTGKLGPRDKEGEPIKFNNANFEKANLANLDIFNTCFDYAVLSQARMSNCKIGKSAQKDKNTTFIHANLSEADMLKCVIERCDFKNAELDKIILIFSQIFRTDMEGSRLSEASLSESCVEDCNFAKAYCKDMSLKGARVANCSFSYATMISVDMSDADFEKCNFEDAVCRDSLMVRTGFSDCSFERCVLSNVRIVGKGTVHKRISCCKFNYANFSDAAITNIEFKECDFTNADFSRARLINVQFNDCIGLKTVLTSELWMAHVNFSGKKQEKLIDSRKNWRYCDDEMVTGERQSIREVIHRRRSTRRFSKRKVDKISIDKILSAASQAPSPKNDQPWTFCVKTGDEVGKVADIMMTSLIILQKENEQKGIDRVDIIEAFASIEAIRTSSVIIFVYLDNHAFTAHDDGVNWELHAKDVECTHIQAVGAAIENMLLEATDMNIDSLWIGDIFYCYNALTDYLGLDGCLMAAVAFGYGDEEKPQYKTSRKKLEDIVQWDYSD